MLNVKFIVVGGLKEAYLRDAVAEYKKRLSAFCTPEIVELKEARLPDSPSGSDVRAALTDEGKRILSACPTRSVKVALLSPPIQRAILHGSEPPGLSHGKILALDTLDWSAQETALGF